MQVVGEDAHRLNLEWQCGVGLAPGLAKAMYAQIGGQKRLAVVRDNREKVHATFESYPSIPRH
jgi:hypothetical protein